jgi:large subunit ribosomal protein L7A
MVDRLIGKKVVGIKQSIKSIKSGEGKTVFVAMDADAKLIQQVVKLAEEYSLEVIYVNSMKELGKLCGIDVGAATAVLLKE